MATNKVILYFDSKEDAVRFTVAAGSVMSGGAQDCGTDVVRQVERANRVRAKGSIGSFEAQTLRD
jgi:hypothetical protein